MANVKAADSCFLRNGYEYIKNVANQTADKANELYKDGSQKVKQAYDTSASVFNAFDKTSQVAMASTVGGGIVSAASFATLFANIVKNPMAQKILKGTGLAGLAVFVLGSLTTSTMALVNKKAEMDKDDKQEKDIKDKGAKITKLEKDIEAKDAEHKKAIDAKDANHKKAIEAKDAEHKKAIDAKDAVIKQKQAELATVRKNAAAIGAQDKIVKEQKAKLGDVKKGLLASQIKAEKDLKIAKAAQEKAQAKVAALEKQLKDPVVINKTAEQEAINANTQRAYEAAMAMYNKQQKAIEAWDEYRKNPGSFSCSRKPSPAELGYGPDPRISGNTLMKKPQTPSTAEGSEYKLLKTETEKVKEQLTAAKTDLDTKKAAYQKALTNKNTTDKQVTEAKKALNAAQQKLGELTKPAAQAKKETPAEQKKAA